MSPFFVACKMARPVYSVFPGFVDEEFVVCYRISLVSNPGLTKDRRTSGPDPRSPAFSRPEEQRRYKLSNGIPYLERRWSGEY